MSVPFTAEPVWIEEIENFFQGILWFPSEEKVLNATDVLVHLIPYRCVMRGREHLGSTKDITGRWEYFRDEKVFAVTFPGVLDESKPRARDHVQYIYDRFFEKYSFEGKNLKFLIDSPGSFPEQAKYLKKRFPKSVILYRAHNAEFPHRLDRFWMLTELSARKGLVKVIAKQIFSDISMVRNTDWIFPISEYDGETYWKKLALFFGKSRKVRTLPYFIPESYSRLPHRKEKVREVVCVSSGKTKGDRIDEGVESFVNAVEKLQSRYPDLDWKFRVTGGVEGRELRSGITETGFVESPIEILRGSMVACVLTRLGWGFKTKILEAVEAGNVVLTSPIVYERLPEWIKSYCIPINPADPHEFRVALEKAEALSGKARENALNGHIRRHAYTFMKDFFGSERVNPC